MKKTFFFGGLAAVATVLGSTQSKAQTITSFIPGDVVVYRTGDGSAALTNAGTAVFLDEYNPTTGNLDGTEALSTLATPLVASGTAVSEGLLTLSGNGQYLLATGYDAPVGTLNGTTSITGTTSTAVPREVATISGTGAVAQTTINNYSANNIRSAASQDGTTIFTSGATTGILAVTSGAVNTAGTNLYNTSVNNRDIVVAGGQLYFSSGSNTGASLRIAQVGTGLPTTTGQTATEVPGITVSTTAGTPVNAPYQFKAVTLGTGTAADTFYIADNGSGLLEKYSLANGTFNLTGTVALAGISGLAARAVPGGEQLVASTAAGLFVGTDTSGLGGALNATLTQFATAGTNEAFRGDAFAPSLAAVPEPSTWAMMAFGFLSVGTVLSLRHSRVFGA